MVRATPPVLAALVAASTLCAGAATRTWTNAAGDGDWHNTANWSGGALPSASDTATISISEDTTLYVTNDVQVTRFWTVGTGTLTGEKGLRLKQTATSLAVSRSGGLAVMVR